MRLFRKAYEAGCGDPPSEVYIRRCEAFMRNSPDAGWDGVFELKTK